MREMTSRRCSQDQSRTRAPMASIIGSLGTGLDASDARPPRRKDFLHSVSAIPGVPGIPAGGAVEEAAGPCRLLPSHSALLAAMPSGSEAPARAPLDRYRRSHNRHRLRRYQHLSTSLREPPASTSCLRGSCSLPPEYAHARSQTSRRAVPCLYNRARSNARTRNGVAPDVSTRHRRL